MEADTEEEECDDLPVVPLADILCLTKEAVVDKVLGEMKCMRSTMSFGRVKSIPIRHLLMYFEAELVEASRSYGLTFEDEYINSHVNMSVDMKLGETGEKT